MVVPAQYMYALSRVHIPNPCGPVIAPADDHVPCDLYAAHAVLMAHEGVHELAAIDVPHAEGPVARAGHCDGSTVEDLEAADGRCMSLECVDADAESIS
jgi:hypothetical protein